MTDVKRLPGGHPVEVVGESFYEEGLRGLADGRGSDGRRSALRPATRMTGARSLCGSMTSKSVI
jgi:hypothetical protein